MEFKWLGVGVHACVCVSVCLYVYVHFKLGMKKSFLEKQGSPMIYHMAALKSEFSQLIV